MWKRHYNTATATWCVITGSFRELNSYNLFLTSNMSLKGIVAHARGTYRRPRSAKGLQYLPNAVCCEEHFQWHYMNCEHANDSDHVVDRQKMENRQYTTVNENLF